ncbi:MAG: SDR family oxidoreductase [Rhodospirillaceae bacterium]|nr:SDR family oxidoreductase [Rhodospirillaceae bacterium]
MRVLVVGAGGFIGRHVVRALGEAGHTVRPAGPNPQRLARLFPGLEPVKADLATDDAAAWRARLLGIDAVVNAAGLIRDTRARSFRRVHTEGPIALFDACLAAGVRRVIQISALGADGAADTGYHRSKWAADHHLLALDPSGERLEATVLRPSLVIGPGGASTALFALLAALPLPPRLGPGTWQVQPIGVEDLARVVVALMVAEGVRVLDAVGPQPETTDAITLALRTWMGLPKRPLLPLPAPLLAVAARFGDRFGSGAVTTESLTMLRRGNTAAVAPLVAATGITPRPLADQIAALPDPQATLRRARMEALRPLLRWSIALMWLWTCVVSLVFWPFADSQDLVARVGLTGTLGIAAIVAAAVWDGALGLALAVGWRPVAVCWAMLATMAGFTAVISLWLPDFWLHPMAPVAKNLPVAAATLTLIALEA